MELNFNELIGEKASLYYTNEMSSFQLGSVLFEVMEDENDGWRSSMDKVKIINQDAPKTQLLGEVIIRDVNENSLEGFELVDIQDDHIWLRFGTDYSADYYPRFIFDWTPKPPSAVSEPRLDKTNDIKQKIK